MWIARVREMMRHRAVGIAASVSASVLLVGLSPVTADARPGGGTTFHVDCSRKQNGDGVLSPLNSLAAASRLAPFSPGDELLLKRATSCRGRLVLTGSGTASAPVVLGAEGRGRQPVIAGGGTSGGTGAVELVNGSHWVIQDIHVTNRSAEANPRVYRSGILLLNTGAGRLNSIIVRRNTVDSVRSDPANGDARAYGGISALTYGTRASGFVDLKIQDNSVSHVSRTGIIVSNAQYRGAHDLRVRITGNRVSYARGDSIVLVDSVDGRMDHNVVDHGGILGPCPGCGPKRKPATASAGVWTMSSAYVRMDHNEVSRTSWESGDGEALDVDKFSHDVVVEQNYAHDNRGGGIMFCGASHVTARFNVLQNNGRAALVFTCPFAVKDIKIYNNTVYQSKTVPAHYVVRTYKGFGSTGIRFCNNIVTTYGVSRYQWPSKKVFTADNDIHARFHKGAPHGPGDRWKDPKLKHPGAGGSGFGSTGGYHITTTARAGRGQSIPASASTDFFGRKVSTRHPVRGASGTR